MCKWGGHHKEYGNCGCFFLLCYTCEGGKGLHGECINIMTQVLQTKDGSLLQGLTIQNTYTKLRKVARMQLWWWGIAQPSCKLSKRKPWWPGQWLQTVVPELLVETSLPEGEDKPQSPHMSKLTIRQRQGKPFEELDLSGLELWPRELAGSDHQLLAEYHDVFSLELLN